MSNKNSDSPVEPRDPVVDESVDNFSEYYKVGQLRAHDLGRIREGGDVPLEEGGIATAVAGRPA